MSPFKRFALSILLSILPISWVYGREFEDGFIYEVISYDFDTKIGTVRLSDGGRFHRDPKTNNQYKRVNISGDVSIPEIAFESIYDEYYDNDGTLIYQELKEVRTYTVAELGHGAFWGNHDITSVTLPLTIEKIGSGCFQACDHLSIINLNEGLKSIEGSSFNYSGINSLYIPASVEDIEISHCPHLSTIVVSGGNAKYDSRNNCNAIIETATKRMVFACNNTQIPEGIVSIGNAFYGCEGLKSIHIPASVNDISDISYCYSLSSITVDKNNPKYDSRNDCNAIIDTEKDSLIAGCMNTIIPTDIKIIGDLAFHGCPNLTSISIPSSVKKIGRPDDDFWGKRVYNTGAFNCQNLRKVVMNQDNPPLVGHDAFCSYYTYWDNTGMYGWDTYELGALFVPRGSIQKYRNIEGWNGFRNIVEKDMTPIGEKGGVDYNMYALNFEDFGTNDPDIIQYYLDYYENKYFFPICILNNILQFNVTFNNGESCMNIKKTVSESEMQSMSGLYLDDNIWESSYNGMVFKLRGGHGTILINAETQGNRTLNVKIGDKEPIIKELGNRQKVSIPYQAENESYVYIYADKLSDSESTRAKKIEDEEDILKIYGIEWTYDDEGELIEETSNNPVVSQIYSLDGRKNNKECRGVNIIRMSDGSRRKVFLK